jgi:hypothetical protein
VIVGAPMRVTIRRSKSDQEGEGQIIAIPYGSFACPVEALTAWLAAGITSGPVFRSIRKGGKVAERLRSTPSSWTSTPQLCRRCLRVGSGP